MRGGFYQFEFRVPLTQWLNQRSRFRIGFGSGLGFSIFKKAIIGRRFKISFGPSFGINITKNTQKPNSPRNWFRFLFSTWEVRSKTRNRFRFGFGLTFHDQHLQLLELLKEPNNNNKKWGTCSENETGFSSVFVIHLNIYKKKPNR